MNIYYHWWYLHLEELAFQINSHQTRISGNKVLNIPLCLSA